MKADIGHGFYNVGTGERTSIGELAQMVIELTGSPHGIHHEPAGLTFVKNRIGCPEKARAEIGFDAEVELPDGLRELIDWRANHKEAVEQRRRKAGIA